MRAIVSPPERVCSRVAVYSLHFRQLRVLTEFCGVRSLSCSAFSRRGEEMIIHKSVHRSGPTKRAPATRVERDRRRMHNAYFGNQRSLRSLNRARKLYGGHFIALKTLSEPLSRRVSRSRTRVYRHFVPLTVVTVFSPLSLFPPARKHLRCM